MKDINEVVLQGTIVHKFVTDKIAILTISTGDIMQPPNFPKMLFFGDLIKTINENYEVGNHILAHGNIQSSRYKPGIKNQSMIGIFGESIEKAKDIIEETFDIKTKSDKFRCRNEIKVVGTVQKIEQTYDNIVRIKIYTKKNERESYVNMVYYTNEPETILSNYKENDRVAIIGLVQTTKKVNGEKTSHFENYVIREISKLS